MLLIHLIESCILVKECPEFENEVCNGQGNCNTTTGECICNNGYFGVSCERNQ